MADRRGLLEKDPALGKQVEKWWGEGCSLREIEKRLDMNFGVNISYVSIGQYLKKKGTVTSAMIEGNEELKEVVQAEILDTVEEIKKIREKLWELVDGLDYEQSGIKVSALNTLIKLIELIDRKMERIAPVNSGTQNMNIMDMSVNMNSILEDYERRGLIKILATLPTQDLNR